MINVTCKVKNENETGHRDITVTSVEDGYNMIELKLGDGIVRLFGEDLIQAVENCMQNGRRRGRPYRTYRTPEEV